MNLDVLQYIIDNSEDKIEELAKERGADSTASIGIARILLKNNGDTSTLSAKQKYHYENFIKPLIEHVHCEGVLGDIEEGSTCNGNGFIDDESLMGCYLEDDFKCQICRYDTEKMNSE